METPPLSVEPVCTSVCDIVREVIQVLEPSRDKCARELTVLLRSSHLKALFETHDAIVKSRNKVKACPRPKLLTMPSDERTETVRVVGLRRQPDEPLVRLVLRAV